MRVENIEIASEAMFDPNMTSEAISGHLITPLGGHAPTSGQNLCIGSFIISAMTVATISVASHLAAILGHSHILLDIMG